MAELALPKLSQPLKLWEKLELVTGEGSDAGRYTARIEDFIGEGIIISSPEYISGKSLLREKSEVIILITREDAVYQSYSQIRKFPGEHKKLYILAPPRKVKRVQRRQFVRIELLEKIQYACIGPAGNWKTKDERLQWQDSTAFDLSGGGALIKVEGDLKVQDALLMRVGLFPSIGLPETVAAVCRRLATRDNQAVGGTEFIIAEHMSEFFAGDDLKRLPQEIQRFDRRAQNQLVSFVFQRQVELRQKGLL